MYLKSLAPLIIALGSITKYITFAVQSEVIRNLQDWVDNDWKSIANREEIQIIRSHANNGKYHAKLFAILIYPAAFALICGQFKNQLLNILVPLNESRPNELPIPLGCIDQQKYYLPLIIYSDFMILFIATTFVATETVFIMWVQHACSLFEIVRYRLKSSYPEDYVEVHFPHKVSRIAESVAGAIQMHNKAFEFLNYLNARFSISYSILLIMGVGSLSVSLYSLSTAVTQLNNIDELLTAGFIVISIWMYMFYLNYMMQRLIDSSSNICLQLIYINWYNVPPSVQKVALFIIMRSHKLYTVILCGLYEASIASFSMLTRMCFSYFMMLQSYNEE